MPLHRLIIITLVASAINLTLMIPGGFVETRDFSAYSATVLTGFNIFLTVLGLGSFALAFLFWRGARTYILPAFFGAGYLGVYLLDLGEIFPVTPIPMSALLFTLEWVGTALGALLIVLSFSAMRQTAPVPASGSRLRLPIPAIIGMVTLALFVVVFATKSAMGI